MRSTLMNYILELIESKKLFIGFYDDFIKSPEKFYKNIFKYRTNRVR